MHSALGDVCASVLLLVTLTLIFRLMCRFPATVTHQPPPPPKITKPNLQRTRGSRPFFIVFLPLALFPLFLLLPTLLKTADALPSPAPYSPGSHPNVFPTTL